ncbi:MAG: serine/threonine-protein kinase [Chloroflexales bacterium]
MQLQPATLLQGRYRVVALIAQGGMGAVYRAVDERLGSTVALKQTLMSDAALRAAFEREARLLAALQHPTLPVVSDHFSEAGDQFLVMQFIPGDDLATLLHQRGGPFPLAEVLVWADSLLDALDYLHRQRPPIIHRDIKPQNLKLTARGELVLLDFGLAKGLAGSGATSSPSLFGYTPQYAPLEQIQGSGTDARSDLYALGATFYELLTGTPPPDALTRSVAIVRGEPDPLRPALALNPQVPPPVSHLLGQALALNPDLRPPSAAALRAALRTGAQQIQVVTGQVPPTLVARDVPLTGTTIAVGGGTAKRRPGVLPIGLGAALLFVALIAFWALGRPSATAGTARSITATPPAISGPGVSFADPVRYGDVGDFGPLHLRILEVQRGDAAWRAMYKANRFNDPPPQGYEYYLVKIALDAADVMPALYPRLAGEQRVFYPPSGVSPAPLPEELVAGQQAEVWMSYLVAVDERSFVLHIDATTAAPNLPALYMAVEAGARLPTDSALEQLDPNDLGTSHRAPAPLGKTAMMEDYAVTVLEMQRGPTVLTTLIERYKDVARPRAGYEYAFVRVRVRYIGDGSVVGWASIGPSNIKTVVTSATDPKAATIAHPSVYSLPDDMPKLEGNLLPGGQFEGYTVVELPVNEDAVALVFSSGFDPNQLNTRYFALRQGS